MDKNGKAVVLQMITKQTLNEKEQELVKEMEGLIQIKDQYHRMIADCDTRMTQIVGAMQILGKLKEHLDYQGWTSGQAVLETEPVSQEPQASSHPSHQDSAQSKGQRKRKKG